MIKQLRNLAVQGSFVLILAIVPIVAPFMSSAHVLAVTSSACTANDTSGCGSVDVLKTTCGNPNATSTPEYCKDSNPKDNPILGSSGIITTYIKILSFAIGIIAVGMVIFGGIRFITSAGDPQGISGAQKTILYALVGLVVAVIGQALVIFVLSKINV